MAFLSVWLSLSMDIYSFTIEINLTLKLSWVIFALNILAFVPRSSAAGQKSLTSPGSWESKTCSSGTFIWLDWHMAAMFCCFCSMMVSIRSFLAPSSLPISCVHCIAADTVRARKAAHMEALFNQQDIEPYAAESPLENTKSSEGDSAW